VGKLVLALEGQGHTLQEATVDDLISAHPAFAEADLGLMDPAESVQRRVSAGGGSPKSVHDQVSDLRRRITPS
jgi:argininosuccinate lyase